MQSRYKRLSLETLDLARKAAEIACQAKHGMSREDAITAGVCVSEESGNRPKPCLVITMTIPLDWVDA